MRLWVGWVKASACIAVNAIPADVTRGNNFFMIVLSFLIISFYVLTFSVSNRYKGAVSKQEVIAVSGWNLGNKG
jgi:hypothetical protein